MHNLSDKPRTVVLRVQSPDFRPHDIALTYLLEPGEEKIWPEVGVPLAQSGNQDILAIMSVSYVMAPLLGKLCYLKDSVKQQSALGLKKSMVNY